MTSFKWKRKAGEIVSKETVKKFCVNSAEDPSANFNHDIHSSLPKIIALEDRIVKKSRLYEEGCVLATNQRYWEALKKWGEAIQLCPDDEKLYEMQSQALMELQEVHPAIQAAENAVRLRPVWWVAYQTLGRAQLSAGEVQLAIRSFSKACHLNPSENQLWEEDMKWACSLLQKSKEVTSTEMLQKAEQSISIQELADQKKMLGPSKIMEKLNWTDGDEENSCSDITLTKQSWIKMRKCD